MRSEREIAGELEIARVQRPWSPAPALQATAALHLGGALALALPGVRWPWIAGALAANHGVLFAACMAPRSRILGPNVVRLPEAAQRRREVALTFDDGPDPEVTPRVLDLLDRHRAKASFFCIGAKAAAYPDIVKEIARRGHSVENHSYRHPHAFAFYGMGGLRREVDATQAVVAAITGRAPEF